MPVDRATLARRAWSALAELDLGVTSKADKSRVDHIRRGMRALDDEQIEANTEVEAVAFLSGFMGAIGRPYWIEWHGEWQLRCRKTGKPMATGKTMAELAGNLRGEERGDG